MIEVSAVRLWAIGDLGHLGLRHSRRRPEGPRTAVPGEKVVVAAVGDPAILATVAAQRGEWTATRGASSRSGGPVDPVAPGGRRPGLPRRSARRPRRRRRPGGPARSGGPPPRPPGRPEEGVGRTRRREESAADPLRFADVVPAFRDQVSKYGSDRMALPYGGTALVLVYDRAAFEGAANREAAEGGGADARAPRTWEQLDALARFFQGRDWNGDGSADHGDRPGARPRRRGGGRRDLPGPRGEPGAAPRPVFLPLRRRHDGPPDRLAAVRRGARRPGRP